jgi:enoyl-CoA hydratase
VTTVELERRGEVALVRINRPPVNAMGPELLADGLQAVEDLRADPPGAVVIAGLPGSFSAGLDLKVMPTLDEQGRREMGDGVNRLFTAWYGVPFPVVAAVTGHAVAGGLILALCCDYRVVGSAGKFGLTEIRVGVPYPTAALTVVESELAAPAARRLALLADLVDARTACELGAFDEQVEDERVLDRALEVAGELAQLPVRAYAQTKLMMRAEALAVMTDVVENGDQVTEAWLT